MNLSASIESLTEENTALRQRLEDLESLASAIRESRVDAFVVAPHDDEQVLVLDGCDQPYRRLVDRMQQGALSISPTGVIAYVNPSFAQMVGVPAGELIGKELIELVPVQLRPIVATLLIDGRRKGGEGELLLWRSNGEFFPAHVTASPLLAHGHFLCCIVTDLTIQKQQEEDRARFAREQASRAEADRMAAALRESEQRAKEELEQRVEERTEQLRELAQELTQAGRRERKRLAQTLHDNIQQLLVGLKIHAELAERRPQPAEHIKTVIDLAGRSIEACRELTAELAAPHEQEGDLAAALEVVCREMKLVHKLHTQIHVEDRRDLPEPVRSLLVNVTRELLFNVVKHSGVQQARITCGGRGQIYHVEVADEGKGFNLVTEDGAGGDGFGLSSIRERISSIGGDVSVSSAVGQGTRVRISIPLVN